MEKLIKKLTQIANWEYNDYYDEDTWVSNEDEAYELGLENGQIELARELLGMIPYDK